MNTDNANRGGSKLQAAWEAGEEAGYNGASSMPPDHFLYDLATAWQQGYKAGEQARTRKTKIEEEKRV